MTQPFDFDKALKALQEGQALTGKDGILTPLIKQLTEAALSAELDSHLLNDIEANRRNGATKKTIKTPTGNSETRVNDLCRELNITRQTLYRHVSPKGELRPDGVKLLSHT